MRPTEKHTKVTVMFFRYGRCDMKQKKQLLKDNDAQVGYIGAAVGLLISLLIVVMIFYSIAASLDTTSIDAKMAGDPALNATNAVMSQSATFFVVAPIVSIIIIAMVIIAYVSHIGGQ
jgi:hypothetical protein